MTELRITVGLPDKELEAMVLEVMEKVERGEHVDPQPTIINFQSWEHLTSVLSPKRLELLRHVHRHPTASVRQLALALGRSYGNVHSDVEKLTEAGLLERDGEGLRAEYDEVTTRFAM